MTNAPGLDVRGIDHIEIWTGNARQASHYYRTAFGFEQVAYAGPETGIRESASYLLCQGKVRMVVTAPVSPDSQVADFVHRHGDGVRSIVFQTSDSESAFSEAVRRGAIPHEKPRLLQDAAGRVVRSSIRSYGDVIHTFLQRDGYEGPFLPGYEPAPIPADGTGLLRIDHMVANVEDRKMDEWVRWYQSIFGFRQFLSFDDKDISTEFTALRSKVMANGDGGIKMPINEPAPGLRRSQIQEYLDFNLGPGIQHVALLTGDILATVAEMRARGVEFLDVPDAYYDMLPERVGPIDEDMGKIREQRILVDRDDEGYLLQLFTKPVEDRPTLFYEVIQRKGSQGFGKGNFRALFESIEREQARRGNL